MSHKILSFIIDSGSPLLATLGFASLVAYIKIGIEHVDQSCQKHVPTSITQTQGVI